VIKIKEMKGKDIAVFGGANLLGSLLDLNLVDELSVAVIPVLLGAGKPMVSILDKQVKLKLTKTHSYSNGTVQLTYLINIDS
jgi:dihydrofolate reductase